MNGDMTDLRGAFVALHEMFLEAVSAGFTAQEALYLCAQIATQTTGKAAE